MESLRYAEDVQPPDTFPFPFPPYSIQRDFMTALFNTLNEGKLGIFESPTGTGKSLSLICGSLTWYLAHQKERRRRLQELLDNRDQEEVDDGGDDWLSTGTVRMERNQRRLEAKQELELLRKKEENLVAIRARRTQISVETVEKNKNEFNDLFKEMKWIKEAVAREMGQADEDSEIVLEEYESDGEKEEEKFGWEQREEEEEDTSVRIFFCSRTHSQLTQFVREVKKSPFANDISIVSLASRNVLCINPAVNSLPSQAAINEKCLELGKKKSKVKKLDDDSNTVKKSKSGSSCGCEFNHPGNIEVLRDHAILAIQDIEDLVTLGKKHRACPYYASRSAVSLCELVVLPYNTLLHSATRQAVGLNLKNSVVIIDEAHNLLETITSIHSVCISGSQLSAAYSQLSQYKEKYKSRLKAKNLLYVKQILFIISSFIKYLGASPGLTPAQQTKFTREETRLEAVTEFLAQTQVYNQNILKLVKYCNHSQICNKLHGFVEKYRPPAQPTAAAGQPETKKGVGAFLNSIQNKEKEPAKKKDGGEATESITASTTTSTTSTNSTTTSTTTSSSSNPLLCVVEFLSTLATNFGDAKVVVKVAPTLSGGSIRFLLLDPSSQFRGIVQEARSVIVAGGTMQPIQEFKHQLFIAAGADESRVSHFSCDHVVPGDQLFPVVLAAGPSGRTLDFSYQHRGEPATLDELGRVLLNLANVIPAGMVVFFPSYDYEELVYKHLERSGVLAKLNNKKKVFREPRGTGDSDKVLHDYSRTIRLNVDGSQGALLLAVVGAKMSEGINFSDNLGRAVVMVGMPYPNLKSPELQEKMAYLNTTQPALAGKQPGQIHYENLCMKAVNQSVGRAIRHKGDYASIIFLDHRYSRPSVLGQLPDWIRRHVRIEEKFGPMVPRIRQFFKLNSSR